MINRKKKIITIQLFLFISGALILNYTYFGENNNQDLSAQKKQIKINQQSLSDESNKDVFYNIQYSGVDLSGNRYIIKSKEAENDKENLEFVNMKSVEAIFYFKDNSQLKIFSDRGFYNNKTLDIKFKKNIRAEHNDSRLFSQSAEFSNSKEFIIISDEVEIFDKRGNIKADKLLFDLKNQTLEVTSFDESLINANVILK